jgi:glycosyltransferase involved in cell wall biosynthesis
MPALLCQEFSAIEVICVDDGSTDATGAVLDTWAEKDSRVRVIHQKNGGVSAARNAGLAVVTAPYVTFPDPDDLVKTDIYTKTMSVIMGDEEIDLIYFEYDNPGTDAAGQITDYRNREKRAPVAEGNYLARDKLGELSMSPGVNIYKVSIIKEHALFFFGRRSNR